MQKRFLVFCIVVLTFANADMMVDDFGPVGLTKVLNSIANLIS